MPPPLLPLLLFQGQAPGHVFAPSPPPRAPTHAWSPPGSPLRTGGVLHPSKWLRRGDPAPLPVFHGPSGAPAIPDLVPTKPARLSKEDMPSNVGKRRFPETRWSLVLRAGGEPNEDSRKALAELCRLYQEPLRTFARHIVFNPERAEEVLQSFFLHVVEKDVVGAAKQDKGRFRAFLSTSLRRHAIKQHHHENRVSNGGGATHVDAEDAGLESGEPPADLLFDRLWARELMDRVLARLREEQTRADKGKRRGKSKAALFEALRDRIGDDDDDEGDRPLREVAAELQMTYGNLRVKLWRLRTRFKALARAEVAETVARPDDIDAELSTLHAAWSDDQ